MTKKFIGFIVALTIIVSALLACGQATPTTSTSTSAATSSTQSTPTATKPLAWKTTHNFKGNGTKKTEKFTVGDDWKIAWTCDPASFSIAYNVIVAVYGSDAMPKDVAVNTTCKQGNTSDSTEEHTGGIVYLDITSEGAWTVAVQEQK